MASRLRIVERRFTAFLRSPISVRSAMRVIVAATTATVVAGGVLIRLVDPEEFPTVGLGLWWALQTVTTVGYGDVVPQDPGGRIVGAVIMLESIAFVSIVTAAITSNFVERARRQATGSATETDVGAELTAVRAQLDEIQHRLEQISAERPAPSE
jgi:voltage-gated potassium channel